MAVCIHGIGAYSFHFDGFVKQLNLIGYDVLRYDLLGRGHSEYPEDGKFDANAHLQQLFQLLQERSLTERKLTLIGHSMGGALAMLFTNTYKYELFINRVILLAPAGLMDPGPLPLLRRGGCIKSLARKMLSGGQEAEWR